MILPDIALLSDEQFKEYEAQCRRGLDGARFYIEAHERSAGEWLERLRQIGVERLRRARL